MHVSLRYGVQAYALTKHEPPQLSIEVETGERVPEARAIAAGELLLRQAATSLPVLSGGPDDAPSFRARAAALRAWLWPHSIQNPVDNPESASCTP